MRSISALVLLGMLSAAFPVAGQCVPPTITTQPRSTAACLGDSVTFWVAAKGSPAKFVWRKNGFDILTALKAPSYTVKSVTDADAGVYTVEVVNDCGIARSAEARLSVNDPPTITSGPGTETACIGNTATFAITVGGGGPYTIEWATRRSRGAFGPPNATTLMLTNLTSADAGPIEVRVSNGCSPVAAATGLLTLNDVPVFVQQPHGHSICPGGEVWLAARASGVPAPTFQWFKDGMRIPNANNPSLLIPSAQSSDQGLYQVAASNGCGRTLSDIVPVVVVESSARSWAAVSGGTNGAVFALQSFDDGTGGALYAGGAFTTAGGVSASRIARWRNGVWEPVGGGMNAPVHALGVFDLGGGPALYAAGAFTMAGGVPIDRIAKWDGTAWTPVGSGIPNGVVRTLHMFGNLLVAGGTFTIAGPAGGLVAWDGASWSLVGGGVVGSVHALEVFDDGTGSKLFVGGDFVASGLVPAPNLVRWDGTSWSSIGGPVPNAIVRALLVFDLGLYAGGDFHGLSSLNAAGEWTLASPVFPDTDYSLLNGIGRWDGTTWTPLGQGLGPDGVYALARYDDGLRPALYAGGAFKTTGNALLNRIARWRAGQWSEMQMGRDDLVRAIAVHNDSGCADLYTGGFFFHAGGTTVNFVAQWKAALTLALSQPLGLGSLALANAYGPPAADYFTAFSFEPANAAAPGGGAWYGLYIATDDLMAQFALGVPPYVGKLDAAGTSFFTLPPGTLAAISGVQAWGLTVTYDPSPPTVLEDSNVAPVTIY